MEQSAPELLVELLSEDQYTLVLTGPLSNLAEALRRKPSIMSNIKHMYIMGGAIKEKGNVDEFPNAGEWNFYNSPKDAHDVIHSELASKITLIPLDATKYVPVNKPLIGNQFAVDLFLSQGTQNGYRASMLAYDLWNIVFQNPIAFNLYQFWDTLTAVAALDQDTIIVEPMKIKVRTDIPYEGRTEITTDQDGVIINVAVGVNNGLFQEVLLNSLKY